jgi:hypothetical protein
MPTPRLRASGIHPSGGVQAQPVASRALVGRRRVRSARRCGCTRRSRTPASSSAASPPTSWASPGARCSTRSWPAPRTPRCWPISRAASCARSCPRSGRRWTGGRRLTRFPFRARGAPTARSSTRSAPSSSAPKPARWPSPDHAWSPAAPLSWAGEPQAR